MTSGALADLSSAGGPGLVRRGRQVSPGRQASRGHCPARRCSYPAAQGSGPGPRGMPGFAWPGYRPGLPSAGPDFGRPEGAVPGGGYAGRGRRLIARTRGTGRGAPQDNAWYPRARPGPGPPHGAFPGGPCRTAGRPATFRRVPRGGMARTGFLAPGDQGRGTSRSLTMPVAAGYFAQPPGQFPGPDWPGAGRGRRPDQAGPPAGPWGPAQAARVPAGSPHSQAGADAGRQARAAPYRPARRPVPGGTPGYYALAPRAWRSPDRRRQPVRARQSSPRQPVHRRPAQSRQPARSSATRVGPGPRPVRRGRRRAPFGQSRRASGVRAAWPVPRRSGRGIRGPVTRGPSMPTPTGC